MDVIVYDMETVGEGNGGNEKRSDGADDIEGNTKREKTESPPRRTMAAEKKQ